MSHGLVPLGSLAHEVFIRACKTKGVGREFLGKPAGYVEDRVSFLLLRRHKGHYLTPCILCQKQTTTTKTTLDFIPRLAFLTVYEPENSEVILV